MKPVSKQSCLSIAACRAVSNVIGVSGGTRWGNNMDATQLNLTVLAVVLAAAGVFAVFVAALSSRSLRDEGLKNLVKRWLR